MNKNSNYKLCQLFGYKGANQKVLQEDIINVLKFNNSGDFIALGDKAGRIIVFETNKKPTRKQEIYDYYAQFQAHSKQFDSLRSQQVDQAINDICWLNTQSKYQKLLTTNAKTIKLWKIFQKTQKISKSSATQSKQFNIPSLQTSDSSFIANTQVLFPSKHQTDIHSLSKSFNEEYLLSFDDVQGYIWNMQRPDIPYITVDYLKNRQLDDVKQNITSGRFHPTSDSILIYTTNKKTLKLNDMRSSPRQQAGVQYKYQQKQAKNFFTQLVSNYSSVQFLRGGKYVAARDFLTVKVWDVCQNKKPVLEVTLQQNYKQKLCEMFQNDCIYDKFKINGSLDGSSLLTGNYNNNFHLIDLVDGTNTQYELNYKRLTNSKQIIPGKSPSLMKMNYQLKTTAQDFNQKKNVLAVASLNCFFIYSL